MKIDSKTMMIIVLPIAALALGYFLFFYTPTDENTVASNGYENTSIPIPEAEQEEINGTKSDIYEQADKRTESERLQSSRNDISEKDFYGMIGDDAQESPQPVQEVSQPVERQVVQQPVSSAPVRRAPRKKEVVEEVKEEKVEVKETPAYSSGGFGIVSSNKTSTSSKSTVSGKANQQNAEFMNAILEETIKIKDGSSVVFILGNDYWIDGTLIKKNSLLFGKAKDSGKVFEITINQIKNVDGQVYPMKNMIVYDEKYSRGLAHEGNLNQSMKESTNETIYDGSQEVTRSSSSSGLGLALSAADNAIKSITRNNKETTINLYKGYKVFVKKV